MTTIEIYQSVAPEVGEQLFKKELISQLLPACENLYQEYFPNKTYNLVDLKERFVQLNLLVSLEKQLILSLDSFQRIDWQGLLKKLMANYFHLVWTQLREERSEQGYSVYYFNFVPLALKEADFPFTISLNEALKQQLSPLTKDVLTEFKNEFQVLVEEFSYYEEVAQEKQQFKRVFPKQKKTEEIFVGEDHDDFNNSELILYREELSKEKNAKERMKLANQKLEILMEQMEKQVLGSAVAYLDQDPKDELAEDWYKIVKIDLREYSQLFQKAKYLERTWFINQSLETKSEKMVISSSQLVYEREQVRKLKDVANSEEIFFMIDECEMIGKRVKVREHPLFGKPNVRIMKMDYENLMNKAAYFDLLQAENYLLEGLLKNNEEVSENPVSN